VIGESRPRRRFKDRRRIRSSGDAAGEEEFEVEFEETGTGQGSKSVARWRARVEWGVGEVVGEGLNVAARASRAVEEEEHRIAWK
jgi:hypothetical protein